MESILFFIAQALPYYRAAQDAGSWFFELNVEQRQEYMEAWLINRGLL